MEIRGPVLAATALDAPGDEAIRQAAALAEGAGTPLIVCHVLPEIYGFRPLFPHLREGDRAVAEATRRSVETALVARVRQVLGDPERPFELRLEAGTAHSEVLRVADEAKAALVVIGRGSHERGASLGGVGERIVRHAGCPVLVAYPRAGDAVLAATDFSDPALPAIEAGRTEAARRRARFVVLHSVEIRMLPVDAPESAPTTMLPHLVEAETERARFELGAVAEKYGADEALVRVGPPAEAILDAAAQLPADLVVVGTHGRSGLRRLTLGSVAELVVRRAPCSVLVVRLRG